MKTKSKKIVKKTTLDPVFDLFGEVVVTLYDLYMWVCVVTRGRFLGRLRRYEWYVQNWNVADKVKRYKLNNQFSEIEAEYIEKYHGQVWQPDCLAGF